MIFTKKERHELYIKAKEIYLKNPGCTGICYCFYTAWTDLLGNDLIDPDIHRMSYEPENFPELNKFRPKNFHGYFWPLNDTETRIKVFDQMIKETEEC